MFLWGENMGAVNVGIRFVKHNLRNCAGLGLTACLDYLEPYPKLGLFQASQDWSSFGRIVRPLELYVGLSYQFSSPERSSQSSGRSS